jgi:hypothetical protein
MIDITKVTKVYSGKSHTCACGCAGTYWYASGHKLPYYIDQEDVNDKQVRRVVGVITKNYADAKWDDERNNCGDWVVVTIGNRDYVAYFDKD